MYDRFEIRSLLLARISHHATIAFANIGGMDEIGLIFIDENLRLAHSHCVYS